MQEQRFPIVSSDKVVRGDFWRCMGGIKYALSRNVPAPSPSKREGPSVGREGNQAQQGGPGSSGTRQPREAEMGALPCVPQNGIQSRDAQKLILGGLRGLWSLIVTLKARLSDFVRSACAPTLGPSLPPEGFSSHGT
jgi:hypothetical protein